MLKRNCVASLACRLLLLSSLGEADFTWPYQTLKTLPFLPPVLNISGHVDTSGGHLFFAPDGAPSNNPDIAPLIMNMNGELIWNGPSQHAFNFGVQTYKGEKVLVAWNGTVFREPVGRGNGEVSIWNKHYELIKRLTLPGNFAELEPGATYPSNIDLHESLITAHDTLLVTTYNVTQTDLTSVGGPSNGWVAEAQVYEIDIATNKILFEWKSLDHLAELPLNASVYPLGSEGQDGKTQQSAWGYFHHNSVEPFCDGYLISSRYLASVIAIHRSGNVLWTLAGISGGDFELGRGADFRYQHDVRVVKEYHGEDGKLIQLTLSMHDNHNAPLDKDKMPTSGKILNIDFKTKQATLQHQYLDQSDPLFATAQGSMRRTSNGNIFLGHGYIPIMQEFSPAGDIVSTIQFGSAPERPGGGFYSPAPANVTLSYRGFKEQWVGCPKTKPDVVREGRDVYVSWNGATEVMAWRIYGGDSRRLRLIGTFKKNGFETKIRLGENVKHVQIKPVLRGKACGARRASDVVIASQ